MPSRPSGSSHWLPAPNGIHFHPPTSLWAHTQEQSMDPLTDLMLRHDLDDTRDLIELAKGLGADDYRRGHEVDHGDPIMWLRARAGVA